MPNFLSNLYNDPDLEKLSNEIDTVVKDMQVKDNYADTSSDDISSNLISTFLSADDPMMSEKALKKNPFYDKNENDRKNSNSEIDMLLNRLSISPDRLARYHTYDEIYANCPMIKKILSVWNDNLFQKNPVNGESFLFKERSDDIETGSTQLDADYENKKKMANIFVEKIMDFFELSDKLKNRIVPNQLRYGDSFVELINLHDFDLTKSNTAELFLNETSLSSYKKNKKSTITERPASSILENIMHSTNTKSAINNIDYNSIIEQLSDVFIGESNDDILTEGEIRHLYPNQNYVVLKEDKIKKDNSYSTFYNYYKNSVDDKIYPIIHESFETISDKPKRGKKRRVKSLSEDEQFSNFYNKKLDLSNIMLLIHDPKTIVTLSTKYGSILGYVEVTDKEEIQTTNVGQQLSAIVGRIVSVGGKNMHSVAEVTAEIVKSVIKKIISRSKKGKNSDKSIDQVVKSLHPDVLNMIKKLIIETYKDDTSKITSINRIKARFISVDRMFDFTANQGEYYPYGTSIIDPLVLQAKLYMLSQMSNMIMKLSRAAPIRNWIIDVGPLQNQVKYVEQIKRELYNQKVTLSDIMSFKSMPKLLSDFKDMFTFRKNGASHLDMDIKSLGDASVKVQDLED